MSDETIESVRAPDGTAIAYRRLGDGPAVVALHGGLGSWRSWEAVARQLADRYAFFLVDRRGRGASGDGAGPHTLAQEVADARAVLAVAGPGAALLGHSYGGAVALETARVAEPDEIGALLLYEPAVAIAGRIAADQLERLHRCVADGVPEEAVPLAMRLLDTAGIVTADGPLSTVRITPTPEFRRLAATVPREISAAVALGDGVSRWAAIEVPALLLIGSESPGQAQRSSRALAEALSDAEVVQLDGRGHVAHTAAPAEVASAIDAFLVAAIAA